MMGVFGSGIYLELFDPFPIQLIFWQHPFNRFFDRSGWFFCHQLFEVGLFNPAGETGVMVIDLIFSLRARYLNLGSVDYNYVIASVHVRGIGWLVLTLENHRDFRSDPA